MKFTAVAFDLDGTLYPDISLFVRLIPFFLKEQRLLRAMNKARIRLRKTGAYEGDFYELQARLMGGILKEEPEKVRERSETLIYRGWEPHFKKIKLYPRVKETLDIFRKEGIKMGILSDFPPEKKLENLGINGYWDAVVCSEQCGRLKPDPLSFFCLAQKMEIPPSEFLFVGNSVTYDIRGAQSAGMKTAIIHSRWRRRHSIKSADFAFYDYRQLRDFVLS